MKTFPVTLVLCACVWMTAADVGLLKGLASKIAGRGKHHKRGVFAGVPTFKLGHDIPVVHHSVLKPFVVTYPPTALPVTVKVPLVNPLVQRYPVPVGHRVPVPHPHFGLKFPHHTKTFFTQKPDQHFHHHHHHVSPKPVIPVVPATPIVPVPQPSIPVAQPLPAPPQVIFNPAPIIPTQPLPVLPPPINVLPPHLQFRPVLPPSPVAIQPAPVFPAPVAPHYNYVIRPGNAVQTSFFATYPRHPLYNYQTPVFPIAPQAASGQVFLDQPAQVPHYPLVPHNLVDQTATPIAQPTPTVFHTAQVEPQPTPAVHLDHDGWSPVQSQGAHDFTHHFLQDQDHHHHEHEHHFTQQQAAQVYEHHSDDEHHLHDLQHQLNLQVQQQLDQAQYEHHLNHHHQLNQEYGAPQDQHPNQEYGHPHQEYAQPDQEYGQPQHIGQEYGTPQYQGLEGRSSEGDGNVAAGSEAGEGQEQRFHNHIPLGLQPPIDRPPEHFQ